MVFKGKKIRSIRETAAFQLCAGCGVCAYLAPDSFEMIDTIDAARRPRSKKNDEKDVRASEALRACPGVGLSHPANARPGALPELLSAWGPVLELWEGHAADPRVRYAGSSGGAMTALAIHAIESGDCAGALHIRPRADAPFMNETTLSRTARGLLDSAGSKYAPASPCDKLELIEQAEGPCVFLGKPCDCAATRSAAELRPQLAEKLGLCISLFCAGTPSLGATIDMIHEMGVENLAAVTDVRYRGNGWPGNAAVRLMQGGREITAPQRSYRESWHKLQAKRQWRCYVCADHTGEFADIACGDPWYREIRPGEEGRSLILVRTEKGRRAVERAVEAGHLIAERVSPELLPASQPNLLEGRGILWGRLASLRIMGAPVPRYENMPLFRFWLRNIGFKAKLQSTLGSVRRVFKKKLLSRRAFDEYLPPIPREEEE